MLIERSARQIVVRAPAKLNLWFEVLTRRVDGYHEIETLMCPISLFDTLYFREEPGGQLELTCERVSGSAGESRPGPAEVPEGPENLAWRAVDLYRRRAGISSGARLRLVKRIPVAAGLGGGSSDAAAALAAASLAQRHADGISWWSVHPRGFLRPPSIVFVGRHLFPFPRHPCCAHLSRETWPGWDAC